MSLKMRSWSLAVYIPRNLDPLNFPNFLHSDALDMFVECEEVLCAFDTLPFTA